MDPFQLYLHETTETGTVEAGGTGDASAQLAEGVAAGAAEVTPPEPVEQPVGLPLEVQAELDHLRGQNEELLSYLQMIAQGGEGDPNAAAAVAGFDPSQIDPFSDDYGSQLTGAIRAELAPVLNEVRQMFSGIAAPLAARQEQETIAEGEARLTDMLADDIARNGEFHADPNVDQSARAMVRRVADMLFPEIAARYGATPRAAEIAMFQAAGEVRTLMGAAKTQGQTEQTNRLATLAGAQNEPGPAGGAVQTMSVSPASGRELAAKYGAKAHALGA